MTSLLGHPSDTDGSTCSDPQSSRACLIPQHRRGWCDTGGPSLSFSSRIPAVWQRCPSPSQRRGVSGKQLGRAVGVGEPLTHEEPARGHSGGTAGAVARLVKEPWLSGWVAMENILLSFPKRCKGSKIPVCGQLAPASLWKSIFLATAIDDPKSPRMGSTLLVGSLCRSTSFSRAVLPRISKRNYC